MEHLNQVELVGIVGNIHIYQQGSSPFARLSLVTKKVSYLPATGEDTVESTWHNIVINQGRNMPELESIQKGMPLHVVGRIRNTKYTGSDGQERYSSDIVASAAEVVEENLAFNL